MISAALFVIRRHQMDEPTDSPLLPLPAEHERARVRAHRRATALGALSVLGLAVAIAGPLLVQRELHARLDDQRTGLKCNSYISLHQKKPIDHVYIVDMARCDFIN